MYVRLGFLKTKVIIGQNHEQFSPYVLKKYDLANSKDKFVSNDFPKNCGFYIVCEFVIM